MIDKPDIGEMHLALFDMTKHQNTFYQALMQVAVEGEAVIQVALEEPTPASDRQNEEQRFIRSRRERRQAQANATQALTTGQAPAKTWPWLDTSPIEPIPDKPKPAKLTLGQIWSIERWGL